MPNTVEKQEKRPRSKPRWPALLLAMLLPIQASAGDELLDYGARMCAEAGISAQECDLASGSGSSGATWAEGDGGKTATLVEHGRWVCEQEGVPLEDCQALPSAYRVDEQAPAAFLTVPERIPVVNLGPAPLPLAASPPPARERSLRYVPSPPAPASRGVIGTPVPVADRVFRSGGPPPPTPAYRYAPPAVLPVGPVIRDLPPPAQWVEPPVFRDVAATPRVDRRLAPIVVEERRERVRIDVPRERCFRAVRYSAPPSYRYVTC